MVPPTSDRRLHLLLGQTRTADGRSIGGAPLGLPVIQNEKKPCGLSRLRTLGAEKNVQ